MTLPLEEGISHCHTSISSSVKWTVMNIQWAVTVADEDVHVEYLANGWQE